MVATPKYCQFSFEGVSGQVYNVDGYVSDVNNGLVNLDSGGGASSASDTFWTPPEPVVLRDYAMVTGTADTEKIRITRNGIPTGNTLRYGAYLDSINNRPPLNVPFGPGEKFGAIQISD